MNTESKFKRGMRNITENSIKVIEGHAPETLHLSAKHKSDTPDWAEIIKIG